MRQRGCWTRPELLVWGGAPPPESNRRPHPYHRCAPRSQRHAAPHLTTQPPRWRATRRIGPRGDARLRVAQVLANLWQGSPVWPPSHVEPRQTAKGRLILAGDDSFGETTLQALSRYFVHSGETAEQVTTLARTAKHLMNWVMRPLGSILTSLPLGPERPGVLAGPAFEIVQPSLYVLPPPGGLADPCRAAGRAGRPGRAAQRKRRAGTADRASRQGARHVTRHPDGRRPREWWSLRAGLLSVE